MRLAVRTLRAPIRGSRASGTLYCSLAPTACGAPSASHVHRQSLVGSAAWNIRSSPFSTASLLRDQATATMRKEESTFEEGQEEFEEEESMEGGESKERHIPERGATFASMKPYMSYPTWKALTVKPFGYKDMSEVQQSVLHLLPELSDPLDQPMSDGQGRDLLVKARTGTGKTIAFLVPAIERRVKAIHHAERGRLTDPFRKMLLEKKPDFDFESLDKHGRTALARQFATNTVGTLVISPTRELATQIANEAVKLHYNHERFGVQLLVGGSSKGKQLGDWRRSRPDVVVATPGRLKDMMTTDPMIGDALKGTQTLILDEADTLLEMGFRSEIEEIVRGIPQSGNRTSMLFSATVSRDIREVARKSMGKDYRYVDCVPEGEDNIRTQIKQYATVLDDASQQMAHITRLVALDQLKNAGKSKVIIFGNTTKQIQLLSEMFSSREIRGCLPAGLKTHKYEIHSKKDQAVRFNTSDKFRNDTSGASVLFTTDVSARGVDYPGTTRVIQIGAPSSKDQYIHRIGRTGRAGKDGCGDIIMLPIEAGFLHGNLHDLPVQIRTVQELKEELNDLANAFDEDPTSVVDADVWKAMNRGPPPSTSRGGRGGRQDRQPQSRGPTALQSPMQPNLEAIDENARSVCEALDQEEVMGVFFSLLGFYVGVTQELRVSKPAVAEGLKKWAMDFAKLDREPYVSQMMMQKLGINNERSGYAPRQQYGGSSGGYSGGGGGGYGAGRFSRDGGGEGGGRFGDRGGFSERGRGGFSRGGGRGGYGGDRPSYGDRESRPSYDDRESRPSYGNRESRPSYGDSESRPSYGDRDDGSSYRGRGGSSFGRGRGRGGSSYGSGGDRRYGGDAPRGGPRGGGVQFEFSD